MWLFVVPVADGDDPDRRCLTDSRARALRQWGWLAPHHGWVRYGPEGYPSPPSSAWSRSVSAVSWAITDSSSHFWISPPSRSADRWAKSRACTAIAARTFMARPLWWISAI